jgi:hypothetical protein
MSTSMFNRDIPGVEFARGATGAIPLRFEGAPDGPFKGEFKMRAIKRLDHESLCRAFGVDVVRFRWDLPHSMHGVGVENQRTGGTKTTIQSGFLFMVGRSDPVGKVSVVREGERFRDWDPTSRRDFERLDR